MESLQFVTQSPKDFESACIDLRKAVESAKWALLGGYDFSEILASKGFPQKRRLKSFDICNARHANEMLETDRSIASCMPCRIAVLAEENGTRFAYVSPSSLANSIFGSLYESKAELLAQIDGELRSILLAAASS